MHQALPRLCFVRVITDEAEVGIKGSEKDDLKLSPYPMNSAWFGRAICITDVNSVLEL